MKPQEEIDKDIAAYKKRKNAEASRRYYESHKKEMRAYQRRYREIHKEVHRDYMREYMRSYRKRKDEGQGP